ncbi:MAG: LytTR family DNA-binding domain-containing protein, partial [Lachnospiraceae bacterium]
MQEANCITIISNRKKVVISINTILYVLMTGKNAEIHVSGGRIYKTKMKLSEFEEKLGDGFIKAHRGCLVAAMAIHDITDRINLSNGEFLIYTLRKKNEMMNQFRAAQKSIIDSFPEEGIPSTEEEYRRHYSSFEHLPFAFTDIEMIFDEERHAVDWIFRYGNAALAKLEKLPLEQLLGNSFGSLFSNMDSKWLRSYERATLYGET